MRSRSEFLVDEHTECVMRAEMSLQENRVFIPSRSRFSILLPRKKYINLIPVLTSNKFHRVQHE